MAAQGRADRHMRKLLRNKGLIRGVREGRFPPPMRREIQREEENGGGNATERMKSPMIASSANNIRTCQDSLGEGLRPDF